MNSDEEVPSDEVDSGNVSSGDDVEFPMEVESNTSREKQNEVEEYPYEVLSTEQIVQHMVDSIKEVNSVIQVRTLLFLMVFWSMCCSMSFPLCETNERYRVLNNYPEYIAPVLI